MLGPLDLGTSVVWTTPCTTTRVPGGGKGRVVAAAGAAAAAVVLPPVGSLEVVLSEVRPVPIAAVEGSFSEVSTLLSVVGGSGGGAGACLFAIGASATIDVGCNRKSPSCRLIGATGEGRRDGSSTGTNVEPGSDMLSLVHVDVTVWGERNELESAGRCSVDN